MNREGVGVPIADIAAIARNRRNRNPKPCCPLTIWDRLGMMERKSFGILVRVPGGGVGDRPTSHVIAVIGKSTAEGGGAT
jgi:hypothetical protein